MNTLPPTCGPNIVSGTPELRSAVTACPACNEEKSEPVGGIAFGFDALAGGKSFRQPPYGIRRCTTCSLFFKSYTFPLDQLDDYYSRLECDVFDRDENFPTDRFLRRYIARLPEGRRVLDYGCSTGRILKNLARRHHCYGVETNARAAAVARERGICVINDEELGTQGRGNFDVVILTDVFEHLPRPFYLARRLVESLRPGGVLAIVTGNADAIRTREWIGEFWYFRILGHLHMMGLNHAKWLAASLETRITHLHCCSHYTTPITERVKQVVQTFAYRQFKTSPNGALSALLRATPVIKRAEAWPTAPTLNCGSDHLVLILQKI